MGNSWFEVDKEGLAKLLERRGKAFIIYELFQNCWDEMSKSVYANLEMLPGRPLAKVVVVDDNPSGFCDLSHAFTLFGESYKKTNPEKRGRFDLGEKLVLACCEQAIIVSTTGTIVFNKDGKRSSSREKTASGTRFEAYVRMTRPEYNEVCEAVSKLIPPNHINTQFNGVEIPKRTIVTSFKATLPTEEADENGILRRKVRETTVNVYEVGPNEKACIYEMGIPVVETEDKYHVDVQQKVPVNFERENVPPSYLQKLRTYTLNNTFSLISGKEDVNSAWVRDALADKEIVPAAVVRVVTERFGADAVAYDPSDPEANGIAASEGRQVIYGGSFGSDVWENIRKAGALPAAGKITPSAKPFTEGGKPLNIVSPDKWTDGMKSVVSYAKMLAKELMGVQLSVEITRDVTWPFSAVYGNGLTGSRMILNVGRLGNTFFESFPSNILKVDRLFIHEFGHEYSGNHLSTEYHEALCVLGAKIKQLALKKPQLLLSYVSPHGANAGSLSESPDSV